MYIGKDTRQVVESLIHSRARNNNKFSLLWRRDNKNRAA
jgi:hypothetical protein